MSNENPSPVLSLLGLARRAGRLSPGFDAAAESIKKMQISQTRSAHRAAYQTGAQRQRVRFGKEPRQNK